jgi:hypothetical protein
MSTTSIIQIDVQDEKFKAFQKNFELYQSLLKKQPQEWNAADQAALKHAKNVEMLYSKLDAHNKEIEKHKKNLDKSVDDGNQKLKNTAKISGEIAANFASTAVSIAKWLTLGAIGSGFGLGALAASASNVRRQAQGIGVSTGDLRSTSVNFGKYIDPESTLAKIADMQNDLSRRQILTRLGGKNGQNAAEMLPELIKNAIKQFNAGGKTSQYAEAMGLTQVFGMEDLRRLSSLTEKELNETIQAFQNDRKALAVSDADSKAMQDFWIQLKRAGDQLETGFIQALAPLAPQLTALSAAVSKAINDFVGSDDVKKALKEFSDYLGSDDFKTNMKSFFEGLAGLAKVMVKFVRWFGGGNDSTPKTEAAAEVQVYENARSLPFIKDYGKRPDIAAKNAEFARQYSMHESATGKIATNTKDFFSSLEKNNGLPAGLLSQIRAAESSGNDNAISPKGAKGAFQFTDDTAKEYGLNNPFDVNAAADAAARKIKHLLDYYHGNKADALAAYNWGEGNLNNFISGKKGYEKLPAETVGYLGKFNITVTNAAGSDLVVSANSMK